MIVDDFDEQLKLSARVLTMVREASSPFNALGALILATVSVWRIQKREDQPDEILVAAIRNYLVSVKTVQPVERKDQN